MALPSSCTPNQKGLPFRSLGFFPNFSSNCSFASPLPTFSSWGLFYTFEVLRYSKLFLSEELQWFPTSVATPMASVDFCRWKSQFLCIYKGDILHNHRTANQEQVKLISSFGLLYPKPLPRKHWYQRLNIRLIIRLSEERIFSFILLRYSLNCFT